MALQLMIVPLNLAHLTLTSSAALMMVMAIGTSSNLRVLQAILLNG